MKTKFSGILTLLLAFVVQFTFAQEKTISGTVSDENGLPLPTATVIIQNTTTGTSTDFDGNYSINANVGDVLDFSYVGYATQSQTVGASNTIDVTLQPDNTLDEVVVTALGIKRKQDEITTANQVVKADELVKANNPNVVKGLSGKVSGLQVIANGNGVNDRTRIVLRGNRSISGNNQALIVIDGTISTASLLQSLDPNSIESVNVIKGANGAALYGSDGSNGAIIVTTKKGNNETEKITVAVRSSVDFETVDYVPERQTRYGQGWDLGDGFENIVYENGGWGPEFDGQIVPVGLPQADGSYIMAPYSTQGSDNIKEFFSTGITTQNSVSLSTGDADGYLYISGQLEETEFVIQDDKRRKTAFNFKGGKNLGKWGFTGNVTYTNTKLGRTNGTLYNDLIQTPSNVDVEQFENSGQEGHWNVYFNSPYWVRDNARNATDAERYSVTGEMTYAFNDNINALVRSNGLFTNITSLNWQNEYVEPADYITNYFGSGAGRGVASSYNQSSSNFKQYITDLLLNFDYLLTDDITFKANLGLSNRIIKRSFLRVGGSDLTIPGLYTSGNLNAGLDETITGDNFGAGARRERESKIGAYGQIDLGYKDFLFLNITGRNDWSSVLSKSNNSYFYPSVGLAFIATKAFPQIKGDILNYAKLSASYVKVGNDGGISPYAIQQVYNQAQGFSLGGQNSFTSPTSVTDPLLTPEFTTSQEIGLNLGFLKDRITLDTNFAMFNTTDQITNVGASASSGLATFGGATINLAETKGTSFEVDLGLKVLKSENMDWNINLGYSTTENEVVSVSDQADRVSLGGFLGYAEVMAIEGENFPVIVTNAYERDDQGRVLINPNSGDPIEATGLKIAGRTTPKHIVNLNTSFRYKDFTLSATMDYRTGHVFYSDTKANMTWSGHAVETAQSGRGAFIWPNSAIETSPGVYEANTSVPSGGTTAGAFITFFNNYRNVGENHVLDATAFKLRELSLRYDLNKKFLDRTFLTAVSLSAVARNVLTVLPTENRGYNDPEQGFSTGNAQGITTNGTAYPATRSYGLGLNLTF
ncbi:SusC/RagA family TonB-linked outer membrane protein [Lacinutrix iliipiscaria]|uniref:SusC/RagA family TonB-linked outer membrane protein n=1 Tax=Lacinutrix iliipiscaria TaxID=1230532 RepID=A0ABW5WLB7_9FLAO